MPQNQFPFQNNQDRKQFQHFDLKKKKNKKLPILSARVSSESFFVNYNVILAIVLLQFYRNDCSHENNTVCTFSSAIEQHLITGKT